MIEIHRLKRVLRALVVVVALVASPARADEWWEAETAHFIVKSRDTRENTEAFARELERFDGVLRQLQGLPLDHEEASRTTKLTLYRFGENDDIARVAGYPGSGIAGIFYPQAGQSISLVPAKKSKDFSDKRAVSQGKQGGLDPIHVLRHEYTHFFMMQHFPGAYPRWYIEGFAEMMGTARIAPSGDAHIGDPPQARAYQIFQLNDFRLSRMLDSEHRLSGLDQLQHYATGWLLTHYLSFDFTGPRKGQLLAYLKALADGENSLTAANRIFGDLRQLEKELAKYKRAKFPGLAVRVPAEQRRDVTLRAMTPLEERLVFDEIDVRRSAGKKVLRKTARSLEAVVAENPQERLPAELLAEAQYGARELDAAESTAAALVARHPTSQVGWLVRSFVAAEKAKTDASFADQARAHAAKAAAIDPADPRSYIAYYYSYMRAKQDPPEPAIIALEKAFASAGTDTGYRILLTRQLLLENKLDEARAVLIPVAFRGHKTGDPDKSDDNPTLDGLFDLVIAKDRDGAIAMIDKMFAQADKDEEG